MPISLRPYGRQGDFELVGRFLVDHYLPGNQEGNWLQPVWAYMHSHPGPNQACLDHIGI